MSFALLAALSLLAIKPIRSFASVEGSYLYHLIEVNGPGYFFDSPSITQNGIFISTQPYAGASSLGVPNLPAGVNINIVGAQTTAARTACSGANEAQWAYDSSVHSLTFCDGTTWHKLVYTSSTGGDSWTSY